MCLYFELSFLGSQLKVTIERHNSLGSISMDSVLLLKTYMVYSDPVFQAFASLIVQLDDFYFKIFLRNSRK